VRRVRAVHPERAKRARERQLAYMHSFREQFRGREAELDASMKAQAADVRSRLDAVRPICPHDRVLEVGSGGCGIIFNFGGTDRVGIDPLADDLRDVFPWQRASKVSTIAADGEALPFEDASFDIVLSDNVIDHARDPQKIVHEMVRVLKPGGILYFTVHFHHPIYRLASRAYGLWHRLGLPGEITPFADHTVHLTRDEAQGLFHGLPVRRESESADVGDAMREARSTPARHAGDRLKRLFFKNAQYRLIAVKEG
jgi:SAM-dependent methyltransferase